jgi:transposase
VRKFGCFTPDLIEMASWFVKCRVETVAMESIGVCWIPVFQILEERGIEVKLVNAHYVKSLPGRKSDGLDCQWLQ